MSEEYRRAYAAYKQATPNPWRWPSWNCSSCGGMLARSAANQLRVYCFACKRYPTNCVCPRDPLEDHAG